MKLRIKEVAKAKGVDLQTLSKKLDITYQALNARMIGNPSMKVIQQIADALEVSVFELIASDEITYHSYDENGNWMGVFKKNG